MQSRIPDFNIETPTPEVKEPKKVSVNEIQINVNNNTDSVVQVTKSDDETNIFIHVNDLPKSKEWPQVGDSALTSSKQKVSVLAIHGGEAWVKYDGTPIGAGYASVRSATLSKPPTPEEKLKQALISYARSDNYSCDWEGFAKSIINGEIEGLEYKPQ